MLGLLKNIYNCNGFFDRYYIIFCNLLILCEYTADLRSICMIYSDLDNPNRFIRAYLRGMAKMKFSNLAVWLILSTVALLVLNSGECNKFNRINCRNDEDCPENMYCHIKVSVCNYCFNCTNYNRQNGIVQCVKDANYCGHCLPGYTIVNDGSFMCIEILNSGPPVAQKMENSVGGVIYNRWLIIGSFFMIIVILVGGSYSFYRRRNYIDHWNTESLQMDHRVITPPPPYDSCITTVDTERNSALGIRAFNFVIQESAEDDKQRAVPFTYRPYGNGNTDGNSDVEDEFPTIENDVSRAVQNDNSIINVTSNAQIIEQPNSHLSSGSSVSDLSPLSSSEDDCNNVNSEDLSSPPTKRRRHEVNETNVVDNDNEINENINTSSSNSNNHLEVNVTIIQECTVTDADSE